MHQGFNEFVHFEWPDITKAGDWHYNGQYFAYIFSGAAIFIPLVFTCVLGAVGTNIQVKLLSVKKSQQLKAASKAAALQMK